MGLEQRLGSQLGKLPSDSVAILGGLEWVWGGNCSLEQKLVQWG